MRTILFAAVVAAMLATSILPAPAAHAATSTAAGVLTQLRVATDSTATYDRALFTHWIDADSDSCNTRYEVLIAESVTPVAVGSDCSLTGGTWVSYYDGATWTDPADVDIDHLVPLAEAWRSGASAWSSTDRQAFANDLGFDPSLAAVTDNVNQSKGDSDPATWLPSTSSVHCQYATEWVLVKYRWQLAIDATEKSALSALLSGACGSALVTLPAVVGPAPSVTPPPASADPTAAVYRFWSPEFRGHFYTMSVAERDQIIATFPASTWTYENVAYGAYATQVSGTVPLYRFWSSDFRGHFFTTNEAEKDHVIAAYADSTWLFEGIAFYVYPESSTVSDTVAVARFWSPTFRHHFYTANADEANLVKTTYPVSVWAYENDNYRVPAAVPVAAPLPPVTVPPPPGPGTPSNPGDVRNCSDFTTYAAAYAWYSTYFSAYGDIARLDGNGDGIPCESLPGAP